MGKFMKTAKVTGIVISASWSALVAYVYIKQAEKKLKKIAKVVAA